MVESELVKEISALASPALKIGSLLALVVWITKKIVLHFAKNNDDIHTQNIARGVSLDDREKGLFGMFQQMLEKKTEHTMAIVSHTNSVVAVTNLIAQHTVLLERHTDFAEKISSLLELQKRDFLQGINEKMENSFAIYVDKLQKNPEVAKKILNQRENVISSVIDSATAPPENGPPTAENGENRPV